MRNRRMSSGPDNRANLLVRGVLFALFPCICAAQSLKDCKTVFVQPMPESMDGFVSAELMKWGAIKLVTVEEKADCVASFGRQSTKVEVKSSGSTVVPTETSVRAEKGDQELPSSKMGSYTFKAAALEIVHRESSVVVWAGSTKHSLRGPKTLAGKLVDQLKKDYQKKK